MGWGRSLQRLWSVCMEGVQMLHRPLKSHASCGYRRYSELRPMHSVVTAGILNSGICPA